MEMMIQKEGRCGYPEKTSRGFSIAGKLIRVSHAPQVFCAIGCATATSSQSM